MIKFSKKTIFILLLINGIMTGVSLSDVNWGLFNKEYLKEGLLPAIFLLLTTSFLIQYIKIIKEEKGN